MVERDAEMTTDAAVGTVRDEYLLAQVREAFGRVVYRHKDRREAGGHLLH